jgi:membrane fusion protein, copper/silver efflux system
MNHMERTQMKMKTIVTIVLVILTSGCLLVSVQGCKREGSPNKASAAKEMYTCPMHPQITSDKPGKCSICNMNLVKKVAEPNAK